MTTEYTFFSVAHGTFSKIEILTHTAILNKHKKIQITSHILSHHNELKLEINSKRNYRKYTNIWRQQYSFT
jgi:hypothetical protein